VRFILLKKLSKKTFSLEIKNRNVNYIDQSGKLNITQKENLKSDDFSKIVKKVIL